MTHNAQYLKTNSKSMQFWETMFGLVCCFGFFSLAELVLYEKDILEEFEKLM